MNLWFFYPANSICLAFPRLFSTQWDHQALSGLPFPCRALETPSHEAGAMEGLTLCCFPSLRITLLCCLLPSVWTVVACILPSFIVIEKSKSSPCYSVMAGGGLLGLLLVQLYTWGIIFQSPIWKLEALSGLWIPVFCSTLWVCLKKLKFSAF